jgi:hypothetical protein
LESVAGKIDSKKSEVRSKLKSLKSKAELIGVRLDGFEHLDDLRQRILDDNDAKQKRSIEMHGVAERFKKFKAECDSWDSYVPPHILCAKEIDPALNVEGKGIVTVKKSTEIGRASESELLGTDKKDLIVSVCLGVGLYAEMAASRALDGLNGITPKMYPIDPEKSGISESCHQRVIVMNEVGNDDWRNPALWSLKHLYIRLA